MKNKDGENLRQVLSSDSERICARTIEDSLSFRNVNGCSEKKGRG